MSWFSDLAGKAEDILNKIDQNAAVVLKDKTISDQLTDVIWHNNLSKRLPTNNEPEISRSSSPPTFSASTPLKPSRPGTSNAPSPSHRASSSQLTTLPKKDEDEEFFKFLNGTDILRQSSDSDELRRSPSGASVASVGSFSAVGGQDSQTESRTNSPSLGSSATMLSKEDIQQVASSQSFNISDFTQLTRVENSRDAKGKSHSSDLPDENEMLRKEIRTLNSEVSLLLKRAKAAEEELASHIEKCSSNDQVVAQFHTTKSSLRDLEKQLADAQKENARLRQTNGKETTNMDGEIQAWKDRIEKLIAERNSQAEEIQELTIQVSRLQESMAESTSQCERLRQQLTSAVVETEQYRARATRVLQEKEQIIANLQTRIRPDGVSDDHLPSSGENMWEKQIEQMRRERALDSEEITQLTEQLRTLREELNDSERRFETLREKNSREVDRLQNCLSAERARRLAAEEETKKYVEELRTSRNEMAKERQTLNARLRERDTEIAKLRSPVSPMKNGNASSTPAELEARVRQLATTLVQKQGALEAVLAERNALRLQLERAERQSPSQRVPSDPSTTVLVSSDDTGVRSRVPTLLVESPSDTSVTRRVKRAYSSLDTLGIRLGVFLKRYPLVRIFVIIYVVVLHLWVLLVLLTSTPEGHPSRHQSAPLATNPEEPQS